MRWGGRREREEEEYKYINTRTDVARDVTSFCTEVLGLKQPGKLLSQNTSIFPQQREPGGSRDEVQGKCDNLILLHPGSAAPELTWLGPRSGVSQPICAMHLGTHWAQPDNSRFLTLAPWPWAHMCGL